MLSDFNPSKIADNFKFEGAKTAVEIQHKMDAQGLFCPEPVMMLHSQIAEMAVGECVEILATDPSTRRDFIKFCSFLGHELLVDEEENGVFRYVIRKQEN